MVGSSAGSGVLSRAPIVGRLAPTPSGHLHLGNIVAFTAAWLSVRSQNGTLLLRIEDIDQQRSRPNIADAQRRALSGLALRGTEKHRDNNCAITQRSNAYSHIPIDVRARAMVREMGGLYDGRCRRQQHSAGALRLSMSDTLMRFEDRCHGARTVALTAFVIP